MKAKRKVKCPICGKFDYPTRDHVPPKSCNNKNDVIRKYIFPRKTGYARDKIVQGGLSFSNICTDCNSNLLGDKADKELAKLFNEVLNSKETIITWTGDIKKIIKSIFGHLLATDSYSPGIYDEEMRNFINKDILPKHSHLYLMYYPYNNVFIIKDVLSLEYFKRPLSMIRMDEHRMISCLYFYPLAFVVTDKDFYPLAIDLVEKYKNGNSSITINRYSFTNIMTGELFPPCWPCSLGGVGDNDTVDAIISGKEGKNAQLVTIKRQ